MAFIQFCTKCKKETSHSVVGGCLRCAAREQARDEIIRREKYTIPERVLDLERRVRKLEGGKTTIG